MQYEDTLWGIENVAKYLRVPVNAVYKMTSAKTKTAIPHVKLGGRLRFRKAEIDRWLDLLTISNLDILDKAKRAAATYRQR